MRRLRPDGFDHDTLERALELSHGEPLVLALSGGGDSVALLRTLTRELHPKFLRAVVVDHGLRPGSAVDAEIAAGFARSRGIDAQVVPALWADGKRSQATARAARYRALCTAAAGARVIVTAHTLEDQAETVLMRAAAGSTWRGLAGMAPLAPMPLWPEGRGLILARPYLWVRRENLRDWMRQTGVPWIEDPANSNERFERVRVRRRLALLEAEGSFDPRRLACLAARLTERARSLDAAARGLIEHAVHFEDAVARVDWLSWQGDSETSRRALSVLLTAVAGAAHEPAPSALARLASRLEAASFRGAALGGARIARHGDQLILSRDPGALLGRAGVVPAAPVALPAGREFVWDGRLSLTVSGGGWEVAPTRGGAELRGPAGPAPLTSADARWLLADRVRHLLGVFD